MRGSALRVESGLASTPALSHGRCGVPNIEAQIQDYLEANDLRAAMALALEAFGPELLGFLLALHPRRVDAEDVYSEACSDMWRGLSSFDGRSSFRAWAYTITRNAHHRHLGRYLRRARQHTGLSQLEALTAHERTETSPWQKTENKDRLRRLRASLEPDEQMLLVLRIDRAMGWEEVSDILSGAPSDEPAVRKRRAAATRKRFERLKARLKQLALQEGLLRAEEEA